ncbi:MULTISPECIES: hypothetical protein [Sinorhizobium]|uniref:hypothetical protein n=1 Tax=Sinorhizobium TaxID=28105 RepID=UPI000FD3658B|nr:MULTISPECIES: hypothetical protein [Sinorhizobium]MDE3784920.1 hypothetical protein [Sinorhizobium meliloti]QFI65781.1 hypothetical protein EKH55_0907 [Sinorhizobium alkalisoli]RVH94865.1 hypothetical protein CN206_36015 [Sinorhizobium meliloti]
MAVTRDQFEIKDELTVVHRPSGLEISTYRYKDPSQIGDLTIRDAGPETSKLSPEDAHEVHQAARELLRELQTKPR